MVSIVIPYFQRERGVLRRTLLSVLAQDTLERLVVLVVDDGSPVPAAGECEGLPSRANVEIRIITQGNAGAAAARNTGLENVPEGTAALAFLDSDDAWSPDHISRARAALDGGADAYMANWRLLHSGLDAHTHMRKLAGMRHAPSPWDPTCRLFHGNFFMQELANPIGRISTLVLRWESVKRLRFETRFLSSGEDILYRLELARLNPIVAFSTNVEVESGFGVNQYDSQSWGTAKAFRGLRDRLLLHKLALRRFTLSAEEKAVARRGLRDARYAAVLNALAVLRSGGQGLASGVSDLLRVDGWIPLATPGALLAWACGSSRRL